MVSLHRRLLPHTASSRAGERAVRALYGALSRGSEAVVLIASDDAHDAEGSFASGTVRLRETERRVRAALRTDAPVAARLALYNLLAPAHVCARLWWDRTIPQGKVGYVLTIGVTPRSAVRGSAVLLGLERELARLGAASFWVDTEASNARAIAFYERNAYEVVSRRFGQVLLRKPG